MTEPDAAVPSRPRRPAVSVLSAALIVLGLVLAPLGLVSGYLRAEIATTDSFVSAFAPLAADPAVQQYVIDKTVAVIDESIDIDGTTRRAFDAISGLGLSDRAASALGLLEGPAASALAGLVTSSVTGFVQSDAFPAVWETALRATHTQLIATLEGDPAAAVSLASGGEIELQLGPIVSAVRERLVDGGVGIAAAIPDTSRSVQIAQIDSPRDLKVLYALVLAAGAWLGPIALLLVVAGTAIARRRRRALAVAGLVLAALMALVSIAIGLVHLLAVAAVGSASVAGAALGALIDAAADPIHQTAVAVAVIGASAALLAWITGSGRIPVAARGIGNALADRLRRLGDAHGIGTGRFGRRIDRWWRPITVVVLLSASAILLLTRPITLATVLGTGAGALLVLAAASLARRPAGSGETEGPA